MGRKKKRPFLEKVEIIDIAAEGKAIGKVDEKVVFVPYLVPGDIADIQVTKNRKKYMEGQAKHIHHYSNERSEPFCSHYGVCGGCKWQSLPYQKQLDYKQKQVIDNLERLGKLDLPEVKTILGSKEQTHYRNKLEYTFSATRWLTDEEISSGSDFEDRNALGFHVPGKFDRVLDIKHCYLQDQRSDEIRLGLREFCTQNNYSFYHQRKNEGFLRNLIVRNTNIDEWMVILVVGQDNQENIQACMEYLDSNFPFINSLMYVVNPKLNDSIGDLDILLYKGRDHIFEEMEGLKFKIGPKSFFQTNSTQALHLYEIVREFADLQGNETVYDLYTGTGTIANFVARQCKKVVGIEYVEDAIIDAKLNSESNGIGNTTFFAGDMKDVLDEAFIERNGAPDVLITDPPRAGMHADVVQVIRKALPKRIVYVSCNPATQARDLQMLDDLYEITAVQPVDMFPHTHHVENVVRLDLRAES